MVNKVILVGNLGKDPEIRFTPNGKALCKFSLATSEKWTDNDGNKQSRVEWHNVVVWGKAAEACGQYLSKGSKAYIEGSIHTRQYDDKDGNRRYITEINARDVRFLGGGRGGNAESTGSAPSGEDLPPGLDDDIPFAHCFAGATALGYSLPGLAGQRVL